MMDHTKTSQLGRKEKVMNKKLKQSLITSILMFLIISCAFSISVSLSAFIFTEQFTVDSTDSFMDENGTDLICYPITNSNPTTVAVGWGKAPNKGTGTITIPKQVKRTVEVEDPNTHAITSQVQNYDIKAIVKSGFRYCAFSSISFAADSVVEEIQAEAFYSCQNITTFTLPKMCVRGVGSSSFMDCRSLETFDTSEVSGFINETITNWDSITEAQKEWFEEVDEVSGVHTHRFCIGDHAFSSCVSLVDFEFPRTLKDIGESAFHKCEALTSIFFPKAAYFTPEATEEVPVPVPVIINNFTIGKYAFADCKKLSIMHLCKNISNIDFYAFAQCNNLKIYYEGLDEAGDPIKSLDLRFRKKHVATNQTDLVKDYVPIEYGVSNMSVDKNHPDLIYIKQTGVPIFYDGHDANDKPLYTANKNESFITIFRFWPAPAESHSTDFNWTTGRLTIPDTIEGAPVRRIAKHAFYDSTGSRKVDIINPETGKVTGQEDPLKEVIFNASLIQIEREAFKDCSNLKTLNFTLSTNLQEIGHSAFESSSGNTVYTGSLDIPSGVKYIGNYAFKNFKKATGISFYSTTPTNNNKLAIIGKQAFYNLGSEVSQDKKGKIDLVLPSSLNDNSVNTMVPDPKPSSNGTNATVGDSAFANCPLLKTVTLQYHDTKPNNANQRISFGTNVFSGCSELLCFRSNYALGYVGSAIFEKCPKLKELFLSTTLTKTSFKDENSVYMWCYNDEGGSFFFSGNDSGNNACEFKDLVIYVDGDTPPQRKDRQDKYYGWNSDPKTYQDEYATSSSADATAPYKNRSNDDSLFRTDNVIGRPVITTYYGVDFHTSGTIKYLNYSDGSVSATPDYSSSVACIPNSANTYTVTRCYATGKESIDMSDWEPDTGKTIDTIGPSAFATRVAGNTTSKIVLPTTITTIRERAFYSVDKNGIDIVTYKTGGVEKTDSGESPITNCCFLPTGVTRLERMAFFNNDFGKVVLPSGLSFMGNTAFAISRDKTATISSFEVGTGTSSVFDFISNGMYDSATKMLLYYAANGSGQLDLSAVEKNSVNYNIEAIGPRALARSRYTSVKLPTSLTTIYGGAFENSAIQSVSFENDTPGLKYIAAVPAYNDTTTVWYDFNQHFDTADIAAKDAGVTFPTTYDKLEPRIDISDASNNPHKDNNNYNFANRTFYFNWYAKYGAFANCTSLETFNFIALKDTLRKIGYGAFEGCSGLTNMTGMTGGTHKYMYYKYGDYSGLTKANFKTITNGDTKHVEKNNGTNVLDLSELTNLTSIGRAAFKGCSGIHYIHLPLLYNEDVNQNTQAKLYLDMDYEDRGSWYARKGLKDSIFKGTGVVTNGGAILVGETANYANPTGKRYDKSTVNINTGTKTRSNADANDKVNKWDVTYYDASRYPSYIFSCDGFNPTVYYYVSGDNINNLKENASDDAVEIIKGTDSTTKYWTKYVDSENPTHHIYVLFNNKAELRSYFGL